MAALFLIPRARPLLIFSTGLGLASFYVAQTYHCQRPLLCEPAAGATPMTTVSESLRTYSNDAKVPVIKDGRPNPNAYGQIATGSVLGLLGGLAVSTFSRTLTFLFGLLVFGAQFMASRGFNILPTSRIQRYIKGIDIKSAIEDNVALKLSFGATFILASFAEF